jgi:hypothetical protein
MIKSAAQSSLLNDTRYTSMSAGIVPSNEYLISTTILDTAVSNVIFDVSSFAGIYKHLQIVYVARNTENSTGTGADFRVELNGNSSSIYSNHFLSATGSGSVSSSAATSAASMRLSFTIRDGRTAGAFSAGILDILDPYSATKNTTVRLFDGYADSGIGFVVLSSGLFNSTAPVSSIKLFNDAFNFKAGSRFSIYGVTA